MTQINPAALAEALKAEGWREVGRGRHHVRFRLDGQTDLNSLPVFEEDPEAAVLQLQKWADEGGRAARVLGRLESIGSPEAAPEYAAGSRVWSVMLRDSDGYRPVGVEGDRTKAESEMYDWGRDCPGEVAYGYYDRTGWRVEPGSGQ
jgi:hypothetical protein